MAFDPAFLDELRARTPIAAVIGRKTKLARSGRQMKGCCPFHGEKTPSFYVYDDHFHCFGCGAHGDVISFLMQSEGHSFLESVNQLAAEAGLEVPKASAAERGRAERKRTLFDVLDAAQDWFARALRSPDGRQGMAYLRGRGLSEEAVAAHGLGWSGNGRGVLLAALRDGGFEPDLVAEAGLLRLDEEGRPKGELFFNRVTFPIRDGRGQVISFGGRILGDGQPKYLNGPETPVFSKRRTLFGLDLASRALRGSRPGTGTRLLVVEGYMDVIVLHAAGFAGAVAPLGTALTAEQLEAAWRLDPAPVLCFDGDAAGRRAAIRAAEVAMPLLDPERTLRFVALPEGEDPDSLVRRRGAAAMQAALANPRSLTDMVFDLLTEGMKDPGPEQRAALHGRLSEIAGSVGHRGLAAEYRRTLTQRFFERFSRRGTPRPAARTPARPISDAGGVRRERLRAMLAILLRHPGLLGDVEQALCGLDLPVDFAELRASMLEWAGMPCSAGDPVHRPRGDVATADAEGGGGASTLDSGALLSHLHAAGLSERVNGVLASEPLPLPEAAKPEAMPADAEEAWWQFFGLVNMDGLRQQVAMTRQLLDERWDAGTQRQLILLRSAQIALESGEQADVSQPA